MGRWGPMFGTKSQIKPFFLGTFLNSICNLNTIYIAGRRPREVEKMKLMHHSIAIYIQSVRLEARGGERGEVRGSLFRAFARGHE